MEKEKVQEIRRLIAQRKEAAASFAGVTRFLMSKGVTRPLAEEITLEFVQNGRTVDGLTQSLIQRIQTAEPLDFPSALAFVGPTGVGKTTTILKLASLYQQEGREVGILTLDQQKGGALEQIQKEAKVPFFLGIEAYSNLQGFDLVLIDTEGCNYYQPNRIDGLGELLAECGEVKKLLTLSAATKDVDIYGAIHQFSPLEPTGLVFTKLDETLASGALLNVTQKTSLPIHYIAHGYPLPGNIELASAKEITKKILADFNHQEFQFLRQLIMD